jgi:hypothetical protein
MFVGGAAVSASIPAVPCTAPSEQAATSPQRLLLPAPDEGFFEVHRRPQPRQVGALEGGLGAGVNRRPRVVTLSTATPMAPRVDWEQDPGLEPVFNPVLGRIRILAESGLTSMMVLVD